MNPYKEQFARETKARTLADALEGADVFVGVASAAAGHGRDAQAMARDPIVFAMANPDPEILPEEAKAARPDVIMATGRSDYPNQVNNVLGFPFIFRGALDCRASQINEAMKLAASRALADLAKEDVPDSVARAYGVEAFHFGREYLIPKPFDYRVLLRVAPAVAEAAARERRRPQADRRPRRLPRPPGGDALAVALVHAGHPREGAARSPKRIVFPEGEHPKILRAAKILAEEGLARPILVSRREGGAASLEALERQGPGRGRRPRDAPAVRRVRRGLLRPPAAPRDDARGRRRARSKARNYLRAR